MTVFLLIYSIIVSWKNFKLEKEKDRIKRGYLERGNIIATLQNDYADLQTSLINSEIATEKAEERARALETEITALKRALDVKTQLLAQLEKKVKP
jgi:capsule polysaccharide export protein KpsE/RkpR